MEDLALIPLAVDSDDRPVWAGIVRTDFTELQFPPRLPAYPPAR